MVELTGDDLTRDEPTGEPARHESPTFRARWSAPLAVGLAVLGVVVLVAAVSIWIGRSPGWAYDFRAYYDAALRLIATGSPYQAETLGGPFRPGPFGLYLYSPPLAIFFMPLTWLGEQAAVMAWLGFRVGLIALTCAVMPVSRPIRLAAFGIAALSAPYLFDLNLGNVSLIVTFFAAITWRWLDRPIGSVALAAALTLRPTMGIVCAWWLLRRQWRPVAWTAAAAAVIFLVTLPVVGLEGWFEYVTVLRNLSNVTGVLRNVDLGTSLMAFGVPAGAATLALYGGYAIAIAAVLLSLRRDRELSYVVTIMSSLLLAPLLWDHYLTMLLLPAAFLASRGRAWGLALPLLCWVPALLAVWAPDMRAIAESPYALIAILGVLVPFAARDPNDATVTLRKRAPSQAREPGPC